MKAKPSPKSPIPEQQAFLVVTPVVCHFCGRDSEPNVELAYMASNEAGWTGRGIVTCPECGEALESVSARIPLIASDFKCPKCQKKSSLKYKIMKIFRPDKTKPEEFEFEIDISCKECGKKFFVKFKKVLKSILKIMSINVGPEGVKISKSE